MDLSGVFELGPLDFVFVVLLCFVVYKYFFRRNADNDLPPPPKRLPPMEKQDMTLDELKPYNGRDKERILLAAGGNIFDVSRGSAHYGVDGPYAVLAGRDASRALATMQLGKEGLRDHWDDLADLDNSERDSLNEWVENFKSAFDFFLFAHTSCNRLLQ
jgi:predicted heme/steroid binding protein